MLLGLGQSRLVVSHDPWVSGDVAYLSAAGIALARAFRLASLRLRDCRLASAQILHRDWLGIAGLLQFWHLPSSLALCLCSSA